MLKACINGARLPDEHSAIPATTSQIVADVHSVAVAGAEAMHIHIKDEQGIDTLDDAPLSEVLEAIRVSLPELPVGVTTGAWAQPDPERRVAMIKSWKVLPDFASVNWHEDGAEEVAQTLLDLGIGVEAGLWDEKAVELWNNSAIRDKCLRVLLELPDGLDDEQTVSMADRLAAAIGNHVPVLLHGEGRSCWPALRHAARLGLSTRIGLEDTLTMPDGSLAPDNEALVRAARDEVAFVQDNS